MVQQVKEERRIILSASFSFVPSTYYIQADGNRTGPRVVTNLVRSRRHVETFLGTTNDLYIDYYTCFNVDDKSISLSVGKELYHIVLERDVNCHG